MPHAPCRSCVLKVVAFALRIPERVRPPHDVTAVVEVEFDGGADGAVEFPTLAILTVLLHERLRQGG